MDKSADLKSLMKRFAPQKRSGSWQLLDAPGAPYSFSSEVDAQEAQFAAVAAYSEGYAEAMDYALKQWAKAIQAGATP